MHPERREQSGQVAAGWLSVIRKAVHQKAITAEREPDSPGDAAAAHLTRATAHRRRRQGARCFCLPVTPVGFLEPGAVQAALLPSGPATVIRTGVPARSGGAPTVILPGALPHPGDGRATGSTRWAGRLGSCARCGMRRGDDRSQRGTGHGVSDGASTRAAGQDAVRRRRSVRRSSERLVRVGAARGEEGK